MLDVVKLKEACRICARELCGNQRRWIFHPAAKLNLQVLLSAALGRELTRDGRGEFACSKCAFMLERMYRFDTVVARVEALSLERLHKLLLEKERLRLCIGGLYRRNNAQLGQEEGPSLEPPGATYAAMLQDDLAYSPYEAWADREEVGPEHEHYCQGAADSTTQRPRRCRGCATLRVADSDYEAVCKVPRRVGQRSTSCGPSTRYSPGATPSEEAGGAKGTAASEEAGGASGATMELPSADSPSPASSLESLDTALEVGEREEEPEEVAWGAPPSHSTVCGLDVALRLLRGCEYHPLQATPGSRLPLLLRATLQLQPSLIQQPPLTPPLGVQQAASCGGGASCQLCVPSMVPQVVTPCPEQELQAELAEMEEQWQDDYVQCGPFPSQQRLLEEQQSQLSRYESAAGECVSELQEAQQQVQSLQGKIRESEARNQKLQERLGGMELELRSARDEALQQERNIQNISDTLSSKEAESAELYRVIEEQNAMLCSLKELSSRSQLQQLQACGSESVRGQSEVLALQASLFQAELQLQAGQRAQRQSARQQQEQSRALQRLEEQLQEALRHRREEHTHSMELQLALDKARSAIQDREEKLISSERRRNQELEDREKTIRELRTSLQSKEQLLEDYCELLEDPKDKRDSLLQKLRQRVQERDQALERAVDDKFHCVEEKEEESRQLKLRLREKERDLERQRCVLANNEETISSLEVLLRGKALELEQVCESWRSVQEQQRQSEERQSRALRERDNIVAQLQGALQARSQEAQELRCSLLAQIHSAPSEVLEELKLRLQLKDRLFQEVLADRTHQAQEHQEQVQDLLRTISTRDQCIQTWSSRLGEVMSEQTSRLQELRKQLTSVAPPCTDDMTAELQAAHEELRLLVRREKESREQTARLDALRRTLLVKDDIIKDLQRQLVDPSALPLVEHLTQEVQELRENLVQQRPDCGGGHQRSADAKL